MEHFRYKILAFFFLGSRRDISPSVNQPQHVKGKKENVKKIEVIGGNQTQTNISTALTVIAGFSNAAANHRDRAGSFDLSMKFLDG